jgi:adenosylcobinamide-phosphate synthase
MSVVGVGVAVAAASGALLDTGIACVAFPWKTLLRGVALKPALSLRPLLAAARAVQEALERQDLAEARRLLGYHLVSRDTSDLTASEVAGATIESVAENLNDSVVAPLLAFRLGGLPAAYAYRLINTADAMFGYHTEELEWFGKFAARTDDVVGFLPARLSALLIACAAPLGTRHPLHGATAWDAARGALRMAWSDAHHTASPNAGWPMAAMAGALGVRLTKRDVYVLNAPARAPRATDIAHAVRIVAGAAVLIALSLDML